MTSFNGQFIPGGSTIVFTGPGQVKGTFNNMVLGPNALMQTTGNVTIKNNLDIFSNLVLRTLDTLTISNPDPGALEGPGIVTAGTVKRAIQQGSTQPYRFESSVSFLQFYPIGTLPDTVIMTTNPNTLPPGLPDTLFARRFYTINAMGGNNYLTFMSLRYDTSESKISIDNLSLFRDSSGVLFNMGRYDFLDSDLVAISLDSVKRFSNWYFGRWDYYPLHPYEFTDSLIITDHGNITDALIFGATDGATDGIDPYWGESPLGPTPDYGIFDLRWTLPSSEESKTDIRALLTTVNQQRTYKFSIQPGPAGYPMAVCWKKTDLPLGTFFIRDQATHGGQFNINMKMEELLLVTNTGMSPIEIVHKIPLYYPFNTGWNMMSLPLKPANDGRRITTFPSAISEAFGYDGGYYVEDTLHIGRGYWIRFGTTQAIGFEGSLQATDSISVIDGWNMIGAGSTPIPKSSIAQVPSGIVISNYFQFQNGYTPADTLIPSRGYWVKTSVSGMLVLKSSGTLPKQTDIDASAAEVSKLNTLIVMERSGNQQRLYFGAPPSSTFKSEFFQMPPSPPSGAFDVRFATGSMVMVGTQRQLSETIRLQTTSFPVKISWRFQQQRVSAVTFHNAANGKVLYHSESGIDGSFEISDPRVTRIAFTVEMNPIIPERFSLKQNYPNPFNPTTSILFDLPIDAFVSIKVYNLLGQEVAVLSDNQLYAAGTHTTTFDASNFSSGVYFYRCIALGLDGRKFLESRKMLLLK
ncbi:MAG: T9SS type A sorting domain-containing protein [Ignavibacteriae bacterium]|nr:T9SS type A sorting domain-containing protein [Ignavibacteriota bacterium]